MATKITAARIATAAGCHTVICLASEPERMTAVMAGERVGTVFRPHPNALRHARPCPSLARFDGCSSS